MRIKLEELLGDAKDVEQETAEIVELFLQTTYGEFGANALKVCADGFREMAEEYGFDPECLNDLTYMELACLIYNVAEEEFLYEGTWGTTESFRLFLTDALRVTLHDARKTCIPVRAFMELRVKDFYMYLEGRRHNKVCEMEYEELKEWSGNYVNYEIKEDLTFRELLAELDKLSKTAWKPYVDWEYFKQKITTVYDMVGKSLIESFQKAYPEKFHAGDVVERLQPLKNIDH